MIIIWCSDYLSLVAKLLYILAPLLCSLEQFSQGYLKCCSWDWSPQYVCWIKQNSQLLGCAYFLSQQLTDVTVFSSLYILASFVDHKCVDLFLDGVTDIFTSYLPGSKSRLLSNTQKWIVWGDTCADKTRQIRCPFLGRSALAESRSVREPRKTALTCGTQSQLLWW